jgi:hypothetical protein
LAGRRAITAAEPAPAHAEPGPGRALRWPVAVVPACYLIAAVILTWRLWADPATRTVAGNPTDADLFAWYLRYAADAVGHLHLPALVSTAMNAPTGVNLMWNTSVLLLGVLLSPVTLLFGAQASLTVLTTLGFAGSACALFFVLRRWQVSVGAAALAGAVYGFSPAMVHSSLGHYNLQFAVLPPLIIDAGLALAAGRPAGARRAEAAERRADVAEAAGRRAEAAERRAEAAERRAEGGGRRAVLARVPAVVWDGIRLGLLLAAQLFISEEIALITAIAGVLLVAGLVVSRPAAAARRAWPAAGGVLAAAIVAFCLAGHALWTQFAGPLAQHGPLFPPDYYVNDPVSFVTPSSYLLLHTAGTAATAARYQGGATEYLAYLGWPLIIVLVLAAAVGWRRPAARAAAFTLVVLGVFSLGGYPLIGGTLSPSVTLPWHWLEEHQLFASVLPDRLSIIADGVAAALLAFGIDAGAGVMAERRRRRAGAWARGEAGVRGAGGARGAGGVRGAGGARGAAWAPVPGRAASAVLTVAALSCMPLLPVPLAAGTATPLPLGWTQTFTALNLPAGAPVLIVPVPANILTATMRWQADTGQPDSIVGGYFIGPGAGGQAYIGGTGVNPVAWYLDQLWASGLAGTSPFAAAALGAGLPVAIPGGGPAPTGQAPQAAQVRAALAAWHRAAVVAVTAASSPLAGYLVHLLGPPTVQSGIVLAWRR